MDKRVIYDILGRVETVTKPVKTTKYYYTTANPITVVATSTINYGYTYDTAGKLISMTLNE